MDRDHKRNSVILFGENPAEMAVPSVAMDDIGIDVRRVEIGAAPHRTESRFQRFGAGETTRVEFEAGDFEITFLNTLIAKTTDFDRHGLRQLARQIADVNARAAINVRRIFVCEKKDLHRRWSIGVMEYWSGG
jgi:hypothetical protein